MKPLHKFALVALIATLPSLMAPPECAALNTITERYYSDGTYTVLVGKCVDNPCAGTYTCTGTMTDYVRVTVTHCTIVP